VTEASGALEALLAVQDLDTALTQLQHHRAHLPERAARADALAAVAAATATLDEVATRRQVLADGQSRLERSLRELDARYADLAAKLPRTMVVREAEALMAEQHSVAARRSSVEDEELALLEEDEGLDGEEAGGRQTLLAAQERVRSADGALAEVEAVLDEQEAELRQRREATSADVPEELLKRYGELRDHFGGVAVARLVGGRCTGCHLALANAALERIRSAPPDALVECEECGRFLVR
jgi:predicted  nucleic acid-binding Zn-ribbon protein